MKVKLSSAVRRPAFLLGVAALATHAALLEISPPVNVSNTPTPTEKAKVARLAYADGGVFRKVWLYTYADGAAGRQNIYVRLSFDDGARWQAPVLLSRDGAGAPTGGQAVTTGVGTFVADNDMPSVFAPPVTSRPQVTIVWNSAYCPQDPTAGTSGSYANAVQGTGDLDRNGTPERPFHCVWVATTTDPALASWNVQQLTNGERDATNEVVAGNASGSGLAVLWQEDPAGLQPGEAEGPGDGGSGAHVTGGTNLWYTYAPAPNGATLRANIRQLTDNDATGTGQPGASRPMLSFSGPTALVAYEETACPGGAGGKCIVYHSFPYATPDTHAAGTVVSDASHNARRARIVQQGAAAAGSSPLRTVLLWRESLAAAPNEPADIMLRRGFAQPSLRPGSTGFQPADIVADTPQNMTRIAASGGNANAHRAVLRGSAIALAYDLTADAAGADPAKTTPTTATYNLFLTRSSADGEPGTWSAAANLSGLTSAAERVVEPRLVPTPGTVVNPLTGKPDAGDQQDADVLYAAYATQANTASGTTGHVFVSRSTDFGARFAPFAPVVAGVPGQSESQLRPAPDGAWTGALWMSEQVPGDPSTKDAMFAVVTAPLPDLAPTGDGVWFPPGGQAAVRINIANKGPGDARRVTLTGNLSPGLSLLGVTGAGTCEASGTTFSCYVPELAAGASEPAIVTVTTAETGSFSVAAVVANAAADANAADNTVSIPVVSVAPLPPAAPQPSADVPPSPPPASDTAAPQPPATGPAQATGSGGGCTTAPPGAPFDPILPALAVLGFASAFVRRRHTDLSRERTTS